MENSRLAIGMQNPVRSDTLSLAGELYVLVIFLWLAARNDSGEPFTSST